MQHIYKCKPYTCTVLHQVTHLGPYLCSFELDIFNLLSFHLLSAFRTREDRQPTSEFVAACPCPDGLMQDGTQEGG
jgi:hypothetical protein